MPVPVTLSGLAGAIAVQGVSSGGEDRGSRSLWDAPDVGLS